MNAWYQLIQVFVKKFHKVLHMCVLVDYSMLVYCYICFMYHFSDFLCSVIFLLVNWFRLFLWCCVVDEASCSSHFERTSLNICYRIV